jgi:hypothetical protein
LQARGHRAVCAVSGPLAGAQDTGNYSSPLLNANAVASALLCAPIFL